LYAEAAASWQALPEDELRGESPPNFLKVMFGSERGADHTAHKHLSSFVSAH